MRSSVLLCCFSTALLCAACGAALPPLDTDARAREKAAIAAVLDDWHAAAARSDEARYFGHLDDEAIFLGTDATERWGKRAFRAYAHPHFERGRGWAFEATRRAITLDARGELAWFDEDLSTAGLGPARGSGVLRRGARGAWKIVQYNLALTIPNDRFEEVRALLDDPPPTGTSRVPDGV